uniref:C2H2 AKAP95-type domain-containing protein n=1 Tax=Taeniopygia guttata TaxID=59729 RepID=A0A674GAQ7_TAEGU
NSRIFPVRYDPYESYGDSRVNDRDPYRPDVGDFYGRPPPPPREQQFPGKFREDLSARGWGRERPFPAFPAFPARGGWADPRGPGRRLPSLFSHNILPEAGRAFPGSGRGLKRLRRGWRLWDAEFRVSRGSSGGFPLGFPWFSMLRRKNSRDFIPGGFEIPEFLGFQEGEDEEGRDSEKGALGHPEENSQISQRLPAGRKSQERQKKRHRDRMVERIQFVCSLCKFRTFFEDEIRQHLESKFHREHFQFVGARLPPQTAQFLQEYVANKTRKTEERRRGIRDINAVIQQIQREQDLTQDLGLDQFVRKVEAAHCSACDLLLPMHFGSIQRHLRAPEHNHNRRAMLEHSKRASLAVARSILNNKTIGSKLQRFLQVPNPGIFGNSGRFREFSGIFREFSGGFWGDFRSFFGNIWEFSEVFGEYLGSFGNSGEFLGAVFGNFLGIPGIFGNVGERLGIFRGSGEVLEGFLEVLGTGLGFFWEF